MPPSAFMCATFALKEQCAEARGFCTAVKCMRIKTGCPDYVVPVTTTPPLSASSSPPAVRS
eukprot:651788-Amphidinium_carterae.1